MQKRIMIADERLIADDIASQLRKGGYAIAAISSSGEDPLTVLRESTICSLKGGR
jgi:hypothetical protein